MDSPDTSLYKPVSLSDTLTQNSKRAYRSSGATLTSSTSTLRLAGGPRPSIAQTPSVHSRDRSDVARREAAAMCEVLGLSGGAADSAAIDATPRPSSTRILSSGRSLNSASVRPATAAIREKSPFEVISLKTTLEDKDREIVALRKELAAALRDLQKRDSPAAQAAAASASSGLDIKQMEELERAFADQEKLLAGYQKELEKQAEELDRTRTRSRRMAEYLETAYGPAYEDELGLSDRSSRGGGGGGGSTSPAVRHKLVARASIAGGPASLASLSRATTVPAGLAAHAISELSESEPATLDADPESDSTRSPQPLISPSATTFPPAPAREVPTAALAQHLDSVQALLRAMEARLISRDVELAEIEARARQEALAAQEKQHELEALVAESRDPMRTVAAV
ncbi:hypothetical protein JCM3774_003266 [Rhodotorula dairenensis]